MSLINDALRRAGETDRRRQRVTPRISPLQPVRPYHRTGAGLKWVAGMLVVVFAVSVWLLWRALPPSPTAPPRSSVNPTTTTPPLTAHLALPQRPPPTPDSQPKPQTTIQVNTNLVVREATPPVPTREPTVNPEPEPAKQQTPPMAAPMKPEFPDLTLQGLFGSSPPLAMINGVTVGVGDTVQGARVVAIHLDNVQLEWDGSNRTLRLR